MSPLFSFIDTLPTLLFFCYPIETAFIAQWIELFRPKEEMWVRFLLKAHLKVLLNVPEKEADHFAMSSVSKFSSSLLQRRNHHASLGQGLLKYLKCPYP